MLKVLLESKAVRARRVGGTVTSTLVHAAIVAGGIMLTVQSDRVDTRTTSDIGHPIYIPIKPRPRPAGPRVPPTRSTQGPVITTDPVPPIVLTTPNPPGVNVDVMIDRVPDQFGSALGNVTDGSLGGPPGLSGPADGVIEERYVDRSPRLMGRPAQPTFPYMLRERGHNGRVVVQFVVDTLGRAEMGGLQVVEASDPLFAESVRAVLPRYRFSPGEAGGRKVRTLVALPFDFTLVR
jgi:protein TonB